MQLTGKIILTAYLFTGLWFHVVYGRSNETDFDNKQIQGYQGKKFKYVIAVDAPGSIIHEAALVDCNGYFLTALTISSKPGRDEVYQDTLASIDVEKTGNDDSGTDNQVITDKEYKDRQKLRESAESLQNSDWINVESNHDPGSEEKVDKVKKLKWTWLKASMLTSQDENCLRKRPAVFNEKELNEITETQLKPRNGTCFNESASSLADSPKKSAFRMRKGANYQHQVNPLENPKSQVIQSKHKSKIALGYCMNLLGLSQRSKWVACPVQAKDQKRSNIFRIMNVHRTNAQYLGNVMRMKMVCRKVDLKFRPITKRYNH